MDEVGDEEPESGAFESLSRAKHFEGNIETNALPLTKIFINNNPQKYKIWIRIMENKQYFTISVWKEKKTKEI